MMNRKEEMHLEMFIKDGRLKVVTVFDENRASSYLMQSILSKVSAAHAAEVDFCTMDSTEAARVISSRNIHKLPVSFFIFNGEIVEIFHGLVSEDSLNQSIMKYQSHGRENV